MAEKRRRGQNFTADEKERLVKLLMMHKETILNKKTDGTTNEAKQKAWIKLTDSFNSSGTVYRAKESLLKMWEKLKMESKIYYQNNKRSTTGTGGGPGEVKVDPVLEQVCAILGRACTGILGVQDCDSDLCADSDTPYTNIVICENNNVVYEYHNIEETQVIPPDQTIPPDFPHKGNVPQHLECKDNVPTEKCDTPKMPLWSRRRPQVTTTNERTEAVNSLCSSFTNVNKKKEDLEQMKKLLLTEEIEFKRKLYQIQLDTAAKQLEAAAQEVEIKREVLNQIKVGALIMQTLIGCPEKK